MFPFTQRLLPDSSPEVGINILKMIPKVLVKNSTFVIYFKIAEYI